MSRKPDHIQQIDSMSQINLVSDHRRLEILRRLMNAPHTISQLGRLLGIYPAGVRYHIKKLEEAHLVELIDIRDSAGYTEKFYSAKADALQIQSSILPHLDMKAIIFMGSHDLAWEEIVYEFSDSYPEFRILNFPIGSLDGLIALRQGSCHLAGCHLLDPDTQEFNRPHVRHIFPDQITQLVTLASRVQGLIFSRGNPKGITGLEDLVREDISFVNRNRGSGTRIWLDIRLAELRIPSQTLIGYQKEVNSHTAVAQEIKYGRADLGLGLLAAASENNLDFIPLFEERYDLIIPNEYLHKQDVSSILEHISTKNIRDAINKFPGYDAALTGTTIRV
jgi:putative molybdopterin biosynthesis protein